MSVPLRNRGRWGLTGMQRDKAPVEWPRSEGGDPTEGTTLGRLLWKPTSTGGPLHSHTGQSQWRKTKILKEREKRKKRNRESTDWVREKGGGREKTHKQLPQSKLQKVHVSIAKAREGKLRSA